MLFNRLSSFYKEYAHEPHHFKLLMEMYEGVFRMVYDLGQQYLDNTVFADAETYRQIPIQSVPVESAAYELDEVLSRQMIAEEFGMGSMSLTSRKERWKNELSLKEKVDILLRSDNFLYLDTRRDGNPSQRNFDVVHFDLYSDQGRRLLRNKDYAYASNRIFLLGDTAKYSSNRRLILKDITIDFRTPEFLMGDAVRLQSQDTLSPNEYREVVQAFVYASMGGPTVKNLNQSLGEVSGAGDALIIDEVYARENNLHHQSFWSETTGSGLGRFDFIMLAPTDLVFFETEKMQLIRDFVNLVKPSYTSMHITPHVNFEDMYPTAFLSHRHIFSWAISAERDYVSADSSIRITTDIGAQDSLHYEEAVPPSVLFDESQFDSLMAEFDLSSEIGDNNEETVIIRDSIDLIKVPKS